MTTLVSPVVYPRPAAISSNPPTSVDTLPEATAGEPDIPLLAQSTALKVALGDRCNRRALADKLLDTIRKLPRHAFSDEALSLGQARGLMQAALAPHLKTTMMYLCEDSSFPTPPSLPANRLISLEAYILGCGLQVPKTLEALVDFADTMSRQAQVHPLGNFSGGLSWPLPMPEPDRRTLISLLHSDTSRLPGLPLRAGGAGVLGYLISGSSVSDADLNKPEFAMEKLLGSPQAQTLEQAIRTRLDGVATEGGSNDYVMTAIQLDLDPESQAAPARNRIAGFNLAHPHYWGQPACRVVEALGKHLIDKGRANARTAPLGAYLLLARTAPEYLVKDIPARVTYGSVLWAQLAMAVAKIEAQTPGRTLSMGYAEILLGAEKLNTDAVVGRQIDALALLDWGAANGFLSRADEAPSAYDLEQVRAAYNSHLNSLKTTSTLLQTHIPSRKALALAQLQEAFPDLDPSLFEVRHIQKARLIPGRPGLHPGVRSMLDIVMDGGTLDTEDHWISNDKRLPIDKFCDLFRRGALGVATPFKAAYDAAINAHEQGHQSRVRQLIATLPLEDRTNLELGKLEFFHTNQYQIAVDLLTPPALHVRGHTLEVKTTRSGQVNLYTIDTRLGTIEKQNFLIRRRTEPFTENKLQTREANILSKTVLFEPDKGEHAQQFKEQPDGTGQPDSFNSRRSHAIADVFVKALNLKNDDLLNEARGSTSFDQDSARNKAISEFFLNLIPLRSAIVNFQNGHVGQGIFDLALDAVGLITLGAGKAAQAGKVLGKALTTVRHAGKAARFVGAAAVEALNPLSGVGAVLAGGGKLAMKGTRYAAAKFNQLRGAAGSYDVLKAVSKQYGDAATGVFKVAGESVEGAAVLQNGKWYPFDVQTMRPYGRPIEDFVVGGRAVEGTITQLPIGVDGALDNGLFRQLKVPESRISGLSRNSQGVYVAADGHLSHIRNTDSAGNSAVYEVRQVTRTTQGKVQARVYHNNRQTHLLLEHLQGDQWQRLGARGGSPASVKADLGPEIGRGAEGAVYASLDGKSAYKDMGSTHLTTAQGHIDMAVVNMNKYYGDDFAVLIVEDGRKYMKMGKIDGVDLSKIEKGSLPPSARSLLDDVVAQMEAKDIFHNDPQLSNFMYSKKDNKIYPVDMDGVPGEFMVPPIKRVYDRQISELRNAFHALIAPGS